MLANDKFAAKLYKMVRVLRYELFLAETGACSYILEEHFDQQDTRMCDVFDMLYIKLNAYRVRYSVVI